MRSKRLMKDYHNTKDPTAFSQDLNNFALKVAQVKDEDLITWRDFHMFKKLTFITMDLEFLASIYVIPPTRWKQIKNVSHSFQDLLSWLSEEQSCGKFSKSYSTSLMLFDSFLCMCDISTAEYRFVFLCRFCKIHMLNFDYYYFLRYFAECMEFTEDSLSFNFFHYFFIPEHKDLYAVFVKILHYFTIIN